MKIFLNLDTELYLSQVFKAVCSLMEDGIAQSIDIVGVDLERFDVVLDTVADEYDVSFVKQVEQVLTDRLE